MPGIVVFQRRWSAGSDDLVVPAVLFLVIHVTWLVVLAILFGCVDFDLSKNCMIGLINLKNYVLGCIVLLCLCILIEAVGFWVSMRGSILNTSPRESMQYLLYTRLVLFLGELSWQVIGVMWLAKYYQSQNCSSETHKKASLGIIISNWCLMLLVIISIWCTYDIAGRKWVKMKRFQESLKDKKNRNKRHSGRRNWRQRKAIRAYEESWDRRFRLLCCCVERKSSNRNSIAEISKLFTEFFRDLDVVPTDVLAGFVLLRNYQKMRMKYIVSQGSNDTYQYLSGVPITPRTEFLQLGQADVLEEYKLVVYYMQFALAAYGWPGYMMQNTGTGICKMLPRLRCCCCCKIKQREELNLIDDNCCLCNFVALLKISGLKDTDLVYVTYHVEVGETPFYVGLDHKHKKVVICIRGTLSLQDVLTDLKADAETLPLDPVKEEWVGHKGMVQAAVYIKKKLKDDMILSKAFGHDVDKGTQKYDLVLVGHSLGAGTAAILAILLQQEYPSLHCYAYSPPGGLLSDDCVKNTKSFITSVIVGKDLVPRIGLSQLEVLRSDLISVIKNSELPKWKIIARGLCCGFNPNKVKLDEIGLELERDVRAHPVDSEIGLSQHTPLYIPGKIIHVVRSHPKKKGSPCGPKEPVYQAVWADSSNFNEVLVSPTMVNDHMPDNVLDALEKVLVNVAPPKPVRVLSEAERKAFLEDRSPSSGSDNSPQRLLLETSFTNSVPKVVVYNQQHSANMTNVMWDYTNEECVLIPGKDNDVIFPGPNCSPQLMFDLYNNDEVAAPLASPETLSEASSIDSNSRNNSCKDKFKKPLQDKQVLETIKQSPESKLRSDSVQVDEEKQQNGVICSNGDVQPCNSVVTMAIVESSPNHSNNSNLDSFNNNRDISSDKSYSTKIQKPQKFHNYLDSEAQPLIYDRHSPVDGNQSEYGNPNEHYSAAGIGYPHGSGAYHPPLKSSHLSHDINQKPQIKTVSESLAGKHPPLKYSQSESFLQQLSARYVMRRSTEQGDIAHLQDATQVFESGDLAILPHNIGCRGRLHPLKSTPKASDGTQPSSNSPEDDSDRRLSSSHSDDVFDLPMEETDV